MHLFFECLYLLVSGEDNHESTQSQGEIGNAGVAEELDSDPECAYGEESPSGDDSGDYNADLSNAPPTPDPTITASIRQFLKTLSAEERRSHSADSATLLCEYTAHTEQKSIAFKMFNAENLAEFCEKLFRRLSEYKRQPQSRVAGKIIRKKYGFKGKTNKVSDQYTKYRQSVLAEFDTELKSEAVLSDNSLFLSYSILNLYAQLAKVYAGPQLVLKGKKGSLKYSFGKQRSNVFSCELRVIIDLARGTLDGVAR